MRTAGACSHEAKTLPVLRIGCVGVEGAYRSGSLPGNVYGLLATAAGPQAVEQHGVTPDQFAEKHGFVWLDEARAQYAVFQIWKEDQA